MKKNMIVGYCYMVADIFHIGHLRYLQEAKKYCDHLTVGVLTDKATMEKKPKPIMPYKERAEVIRNIKCVDKVVQQKTYSPIPVVKKLKIDILFESTSHTKEAIKEAKKYVKVRVNPYYKGQNSTKIKNKIYEYAQTPTIHA